MVSICFVMKQVVSVECQEEERYKNESTILAKENTKL